MKNIPIFLLLAATAVAADLPRTGLQEATVSARLGFDTNPVATSGTSAKLLGDRDTLIYAAGTSLGYNWSAATPTQPSLKLTYAAEAVRFDRWAGENFTTHRLGLGGKFTAGAWKFTADGSSLFIDGSADTLLSVGTVNANSTALWRERRRQWQHRLKFLAQTETDAWVVRATGTLLAYDYLTRVVPGRVAFANRSDAQAGLDFGWKQRPQSLWFAGLRGGQQNQAIVPLPNCNFDYANNYGRLALGWEGRLPAGTTLSFAAGPDFRHYTGAIDPATLVGGRNRTSLWFEGSLTAKPHPHWTLSAKTARFSWLSSTGKSAYFDNCAEAAATWSPPGGWSVRVNAKVHRSDYFPAVRDDWQLFLGAGVTKAFSPRVQMTLEVTRHNAWNGLSWLPERDFQRLTLYLGTTIKL